MFDPDTALTATMYTSLWGCSTTPSSFNNTNLASANRNNAYALWEVLDTSTANTRMR
jgi:hypothetical protein